MEFSIDRGEFVQALAQAQGVVERRNTMPILANVLIEADSDVAICATDLEVHIRRSCSARVRTPGSATVAARKLYEFVRELPPGEVTIRSLDNLFVEVSSGRSRVKLVGLSPSEFPAFTVAETGNNSRVSLPADLLSRTIDRVIFAVSTDDTRANLSGVLLSASAGSLRFVGTDGHRLALVDHPLADQDLLITGVIMPRKGLVEARKLVEEAAGEEVELSIHGNALRIDRGLVSLQMRLVDGEFPNYEQVLPKGTKYSVVVAQGELLAALRRVAVVASERARGVRVQFSRGQLVVSASSPDFGEANEEIEVEFDGPDCSVGFNAKYLTDVLGTIQDTQNVEIGISDEGSPGVIRIHGDESYRYVVMPMRM
jgi:DNA polymerase III subunit beta